MKFFLLMAIFVTIAYPYQNSVGVGAVYSSSIYDGENDTKMVLPAINYTYQNFYIKGLEVGCNCHDTFTVFLQPDLRDVSIKGLPAIEKSLKIGAKLSYQFSSFKVEGNILKDSTNRSNGTVLGLKLGKTFITYPWIFIPSVGLVYEDKNEMGYYYGVKPNVIYPTYTPEGSVSATLNFLFIYNINQKYACNLIIDNKFLSKEIQESPIIKKENRTNTILSFVYKF